ncbi:hypothetical protein B0H10DRAFT_1954171 [Mycena sp. CBHHK59/15]|nr:hypothetical protein B0H10DRAFT_1954171 [Mycena sp. CBHHK59/15]
MERNQTVKYRFVPQKYAAIEPIKPEGGEPAAIGTDGLNACVGVYFKLRDRSMQNFKTRILKSFPDVNLASAADLKLTVNDGDRTSFAIAWAVQQNFDTNFSPEDKPAPAKLAEMKSALKNSASGSGFYVENGTIQRWGFGVSHEMEGSYSKPGFTFP